MNADQLIQIANDFRDGLMHYDEMREEMREEMRALNAERDAKFVSALQAANDANAEDSKRLTALLEEIHLRFYSGVMSGWERQADRFYRATGKMRPGKDAPPGIETATANEFEEWAIADHERFGKRIREAIDNRTPKQARS